MPKYRFNAAIFLVVFLILTGCAYLTDSDWTREATTVRAATPVAPPGNVYYMFTEAQLARKDGRLDDAIEWIMRAMRQDKKSSYHKIELAKIYLQQGEKVEALKVV